MVANIHQARAGGFSVTIQSFDKKLQDLAKRRLSASEESDSGSEDENDTSQDIDSQVKALKAEKEVIEVEKALAQLLAKEEKSEEEIKAEKEQELQEEIELFFEQEEKARAFADKIAQQYKDLGIDCEIVRDGDSFSIATKEQTKGVVKETPNTSCEPTVSRGLMGVDQRQQGGGSHQ